MKKILYNRLIALLSIIGIVMVLCLVACSQNIKPYSAMICGYSDSISGIVLKPDYDEWSRESYYDNNQLKTIKVSVNGIDHNGTYIESERNYGTYETRHSYLDDNNKIFEINDDGILSAYFWGSDRSLKNVKSQKECQAIAHDFIFSMFGSYPYDYEERISYEEDRNIYTFEYIKLIRNVETEDKITIAVETTGHIYSYRSSLCGKIQEDRVPGFELQKIHSIVTERLDDITKIARNTYDQVEYNDFRYSITMISNSRYAILCDVNVNCIERSGEFEIREGEKIRFVVLLE